MPCGVEGWQRPGGGVRASSSLRSPPESPLPSTRTPNMSGGCSTARGRVATKSSPPIASCPRWFRPQLSEPSPTARGKKNEWWCPLAASRMPWGKAWSSSSPSSRSSSGPPACSNAYRPWNHASDRARTACGLTHRAFSHSRLVSPCSGGLVCEVHGVPWRIAHSGEGGC